MRQTVAIVGMGRMGAAMASRLARGGFDVVVYNRTREKAHHVAQTVGCHVADSPRAAAAETNVVITSLADDMAVRSVYSGSHGITAGVRTGGIVLETSTIDPQTVAEISPLIEQRGAFLLDTPVSGSVPAVEAGQLMVMAGGDADAFERARPVLATLGSKLYHVGQSGAGAIMKLAVNAMLHALNVAISEALVLAERAGLERLRTYEVFLASAAAAPFMRYKQQAFERPNEAPVAFSVELSAKDLDLVLTLADRVGASMRQAETNHEIAAAAVAADLGAADMSAIASFLRIDGGEC